MLTGGVCHGQVLRVEGAFASPIEVQAAQGPRVEPPLYLDAATASQVSCSSNAFSGLLMIAYASLFKVGKVQERGEHLHRPVI